MNIIQVMISGERQKVTQKAARWSCDVCGRGVGNNLMQCTSCKKWVHRKCGISNPIHFISGTWPIRRTAQRNTEKHRL